MGKISHCNRAKYLCEVRQNLKFNARYMEGGKERRTKQ